MPAGRDVELIHLDGSRSTLKSMTGGITVTASAEPVLLLYNDSRQGLAEALGTPAFLLQEPPAAINAGGKSTFLLNGPRLTAGALRVSSPPLWKTALRQVGKDQVECAVEAPQSTSARQMRSYIQLLEGANVIGELTVSLPVAR
jgi:hypothetical protein